MLGLAILLSLQGAGDLGGLGAAGLAEHSQQNDPAARGQPVGGASQ